MTPETPQVCLLWWLFFLSSHITLMPLYTPALQREVAYILLSSCWGSRLKRTQEEGWDGEGAAIFLPAKSSSRRSTVYCWLGVSSFSMHVCVCVWTSLLRRMRTEQDCVVGLRGDGGLRRLSHGYKSSLLEQWLELTAVPATYSAGLPHSSDALCHSPCGG